MLDITVFLPEMDVWPSINKPPRWWRRLRRSETNCREDFLAQIGLPGSTWSDLPATAELLAWSKGLVSTTPLLALAPLHVLVDLQEIYIGPEPITDLTEHERAQLEASWRPCFDSHGFTLLTAEDGSWFLQSSTPINLRSKPVSEVYGRPMSACLPRDDQSSDWLRLMTEIQMLCYDHPVNRVRRQRGQASCDALWFYGAGTPLAQFMKTNRHDTATLRDMILITQDETVSALGRYLGINTYESSDAHSVTKTTSICFYFGDQQSPVAWEAFLAWLSPIIASPDFSRLRLYLGEKACYDLQRHNLTWWRKWY